jgi:hypothetical protein
MALHNAVDDWSVFYTRRPEMLLFLIFCQNVNDLIGIKQSLNKNGRGKQSKNFVQIIHQLLANSTHDYKFPF